MHLSTTSYAVWLMLSHASWTTGELQCALVLTLSLLTLFFAHPLFADVHSSMQCSVLQRTTAAVIAG